MKAPTPPKPRKFPTAKQRRMDRLLDKNREATITEKEHATLQALVAEAEGLMVENLKRLAEFTKATATQAPSNAVPVTIWVQPHPTGR